MSLDRLFGERGLELSRNSYIDGEGTRWENEGTELRVSVCGPEDYQTFMLLGKDEAEKFLSSFNIPRDNPSKLAGYSVYTLYRKKVLVGVLGRG